MARKLRIEEAGGLYHVLNRGNYRRDLFRTAGEAQAFVKALAEATERWGWRLHAYAVMRNHFHLALETPQPNLGVGMQWLQSTFAIRFNGMRDERGHLFQGRFKSLVVENTAALARLVDYIHLNPVRAGIVTPEQLPEFRWSSLRAFQRGPRFTGMTATDWLSHHGWADDHEGWDGYLAHLGRVATDPEKQKELGFDDMSRGWAIGTSGWSRAVAEEHAQLALTPGLPGEESRAFREAAWEHHLAQELVRRGKTAADLERDRFSAAWKVELAVALRGSLGANSAWLAQNLHLGKPDAARALISRAVRRKREEMSQISA